MSADMHTQFFLEYKRLGGKLAREAYDLARSEFERRCVPAYIGGEGDRTEAWSGFADWYRTTHKEHPALIFKSVDNVAGFT